MAAIDIASILAPVGPDDPCGPNLEYDPAFSELDRLAQGKPEQQVGATVVAEHPLWTVMRDPAGGVYCLTPCDPNTGRLA